MRTFLRFVKFVVSFTAIVLLVGTVGLGSVYFYFAKDLPNIQSFADYKPPVVSEVFADDGTKMGEFWIERRFIVPFEQIPKRVFQAFIAAEDSRYFEHKGVDVRGIGRAFFENLKAGHVVQGGSTITQQVTRSILLTREKSYVRKIKEAILATRIDRTLSKKEILEIYLNQIFLGNRAYGVKAAADNYFHKNLSDMTLAEMAMIAGMTQAPGTDNPLVNPKNARERQLYVLKRMNEVGYITKEEMKNAANESVKIYEAGLDKDFNYRYAPFFTEEVRRIVLEKYGEKVVYEGGLKIYTTANVKMNQAGQKAVQHGVEAVCTRHSYFNGPNGHLTEDQIPAFLKRVHLEILKNEGEDYQHLPTDEADKERMSGPTPIAPDTIYEAVVTGFGAKGNDIEFQIGHTKGLVDNAGYRWAYSYLGGRPSMKLKAGDIIIVRSGTDGKYILTQSPTIQAALFSMEPPTGFVKAVVGGFDFKFSEFNRATQALRQPGSSFKPIIYASALDKGYSYSTPVSDSPVSYKVGDEVWTPKNYGGKYAGGTTFDSNLIHSRNVPTVKIAHSVGTHYITAYARKLGLTNYFFKYLSMALGANSVYLSEMVNAFTTFANYGWKPDRIFILKIEDEHGNVLEEYTKKATPIPAATAYLLGERTDPTSKELNTELFQANEKFIAQDGLQLSEDELRVLYGKAIPEGYLITPKTAYLITNLLQEVIKRGTGVRVQALGRPVAGKTGTTNEETDAWFIGFVPDLATGVWVGYDVKRTLGGGEQGGRTAAPIFLEYMKEALKDIPVKDFLPPEGMDVADITHLKGGSAVYSTELKKQEAAEWIGTSHSVGDRAVDFFEEDMGY